jgi:hypothetical protein
MSHIWWGKIIIRDVGLDATGRLDQTTLNLATKLKLSHHVGPEEKKILSTKKHFKNKLKESATETKRRIICMSSRLTNGTGCRACPMTTP